MIRKTACEELVAYASRFVSARIIAEFGSGDGRYAELVSDWQEMLANQSLPTRRFDAWEAFGFPMCTDAERESHPRNFRRFRVMVNAFALLACVSNHPCVDGIRPNYTLIRLIDDAEVLNDAGLWKLLPPAIVEAHAVWQQQDPEECAFAILALLLLQARQGAATPVLETLAEQLIEEEGRCRSQVNSAFLFGRTYFDQFNDCWRWRVSHWTQPALDGADNLMLVRDALLRG